MKLLIGADIVPAKSNMQYFEQADVERLVDDGLKAVLDAADFRIFNLEVPLADQATPIVKCGPNLIASTKSAAGIRALGADFLTLANNHILDQGAQGLHSTMKTLDACGIAYAGVGDSPEEAAKPFILEKNGQKIGIYCCAEHEFSIVGENRPGANPFDPLDSLDHIADLKARCDCVIVLYHGGKEQYRYPSPYLQKVCRKIVEKGADLVICQHTHCIGCRETYAGGTIVYGQGNFLFDDCDNEYWSTSLLVSVDTENLSEIGYIPLEKRGCSVALGENKQILDGFQARTQEIREPGFIQRAYSEIAEQQYDRYLGMLQGRRYRSFCFRVINKLTGHRLSRRILERAYSSPEAKAAILNVLDCEVHRECFMCELQNKDKKK